MRPCVETFLSRSKQLLYRLRDLVMQMFLTIFLPHKSHLSTRFWSFQPKLMVFLSRWSCLIVPEMVLSSTYSIKYYYSSAAEVCTVLIMSMDGSSNGIRGGREPRGHSLSVKWLLIYLIQKSQSSVKRHKMIEKDGKLLKEATKWSIKRWKMTKQTNKNRK